VAPDDGFTGYVNPTTQGSELFQFGPNGQVLNGDIAYPTMIVNLLPLAVW
jgi:hypothetical protein